MQRHLALRGPRCTVGLAATASARSGSSCTLKPPTPTLHRAHTAQPRVIALYMPLPAPANCDLTHRIKVRARSGVRCCPAALARSWCAKPQRRAFQGHCARATSLPALWRSHSLHAPASARPRPPRPLAEAAHVALLRAALSLAAGTLTRRLANTQPNPPLPSHASFPCTSMQATLTTSMAADSDVSAPLLGASASGNGAACGLRPKGLKPAQSEAQLDKQSAAASFATLLLTLPALCECFPPLHGSVAAVRLHGAGAAHGSGACLCSRNCTARAHHRVVLRG